MIFARVFAGSPYEGNGNRFAVYAVGVCGEVGVGVAVSLCQPIRQQYVGVGGDLCRSHGEGFFGTRQNGVVIFGELRSDVDGNEGVFADAFAGLTHESDRNGFAAHSGDCGCEIGIG